MPAAKLEQPSSEHEAVVQENQTAEIIENEQPNAENEKPIKIEIKQGFGEVLTSENPAIEGLVERKPKPILIFKPKNYLPKKKKHP